MNRGTFYGVVASLMYFRLKLPLWIIALVLLVLYAAMGGYKYLSVALRTCKRDAIGLSRYLQVLIRVRRFGKQNMTVPAVFEEFVAKHPDRVCLIYENKEWTFKMISELSNRFAHLFEESGFAARGDTVALMLENRPEYVAIWLGLAKAGIVTALINHNLKDRPLAHSVNIVESKAVIFGSDYAQGNDDDGEDKKRHQYFIILFVID